ncbi:MAG: hypothetical protein OM95_12765 [Bdellovibrio sp. ArHS]|uniref:hypothetical protein n=1 Tax=Bdellovibrio sp. ArHS TaxID=1569284 RepID=UPI00058400B4|nr:hypothetical protein [Bdellovibrio sp. ArHS]KHD87883.1 MAG: hypothetical protein OM95_12765 [Bdellovibrio sp. ArHS]
MVWYVMAPLLSLLITGCGIEASLQNLAGTAGPKLPPGIVLPERPVAGVITDPSKADFENTEVLVGSHGISDGASQLLVVVRLMNSDNTVVQGYRPDYSVTKGTGVVKAECSLSDSYGVSICAMKATDSGVKSIRYENLADFHPEKDVVFNAPVKESTTIGVGGGAGGSNVATNPRGWKMTAAVGTQYDKVVAQKNGYKLLMGPVGSAVE